MIFIGPPLRLTWQETLGRLVNWSSCGSAAGGHAGNTARIVADYLRHGLCHFERENANRTQAVHVHQLLSALRRQLSELLPPEDVPPWFTPEDARPPAIDDEPDAAPQIGIRDLGLHILKKLVLMGDCGHLGSGFYLATPMRIVYLPSGGALVLGALPTKDITPVLGVTPEWAGLARAVPAAAVALVRPHIPRFTGLHDWAGIPAEPLAAWTAHASSEEASEKAYPTVAAAESAFEVYAPYRPAEQKASEASLDLVVFVAPAEGDNCRLAGLLPHPCPPLPLLACIPRQRLPRDALPSRMARRRGVVAATDVWHR